MGGPWKNVSGSFFQGPLQSLPPSQTLDPLLTIPPLLNSLKKHPPKVPYTATKPLKIPLSNPPKTPPHLPPPPDPHFRTMGVGGSRKISKEGLGGYWGGVWDGVGEKVKKVDFLPPQGRFSSVGGFFWSEPKVYWKIDRFFLTGITEDGVKKGRFLAPPRLLFLPAFGGGAKKRPFLTPFFDFFYERAYSARVLSEQKTAI